MPEKESHEEQTRREAASDVILGPAVRSRPGHGTAPAMPDPEPVETEQAKRAEFPNRRVKGDAA